MTLLIVNRAGSCRIIPGRRLRMKTNPSPDNLPGSNPD
jgi:hypothetical protein